MAKNNPRIRVHTDMDQAINLYVNKLREINPDIWKTTCTQHLAKVLQSHFQEIETIKILGNNNSKRHKKAKVKFGKFEFEI